MSNRCDVGGSNSIGINSTGGVFICIGVSLGMIVYITNTLECQLWYGR